MSRPRALLADIVPFSWVDGPGNRFAVFLQGCNFDCLACHNPQTIPKASVHATLVDAHELMARVRPLAPFLSGVTVSGGEATLHADLIADWFEELRDDPATARLTRLIDSNGCAGPDVWAALLPLCDGVMLDLKTLDPALHRRMAGHGNEEVLASLDLLAEAGKLAEVRLLVVPGWNDDDALLRRTGAYLAEHAPGVPVKIQGFREHGVRAPMRDVGTATDEQKAAWLAHVREGLGDGVLTAV